MQGSDYLKAITLTLFGLVFILTFICIAGRQENIYADETVKKIGDETQKLKLKIQGLQEENRDLKAKLKISLKQSVASKCFEYPDFLNAFDLFWRCKTGKVTRSLHEFGKKNIKRCVELKRFLWGKEKIPLSCFMATREEMISCIHKGLKSAFLFDLQYYYCAFPFGFVPRVLVFSDASKGVKVPLKPDKRYFEKQVFKMQAKMRSRMRVKMTKKMFDRYWREMIRDLKE